MRHKFYFFIYSLLSALLTICTFTLSAQGLQESCIEPWGADSELVYTKSKKEAPPLSLPQKLSHFLISAFQKHISPIDGPRSSFFPTSSRYTWEAIQKYGVLIGIALGCDRLMRENDELGFYPIVLKEEVQRKYDPVR
jgi:uncharacterized protein